MRPLQGFRNPIYTFWNFSGCFSRSLLILNSTSGSYAARLGSSANFRPLLGGIARRRVGLLLSYLLLQFLRRRLFVLEAVVVVFLRLVEILLKFGHLFDFVLVYL